MDSFSDCRKHRALELDDPGWAIVKYKAAQRLKPSPDLDLRIARAHEQWDRPREAATYYRRYLAARPSAAAADEVRAKIERLDEDASNRPQPADLLREQFSTDGRSHLAAGDRRAAIADFKRAQAIRVTADIELDLALAYEQIGELRQAVEHYRQYVEAPDATKRDQIRAHLEGIEKKLPNPDHLSMVVLEIVGAIVGAGLIGGLVAALKFSKPTSTEGPWFMRIGLTAGSHPTPASLAVTGLNWKF
jgi:tetratricopeptide (TPR) repeat protein